ncbi:MAG TPA: hypothetical protein VN455_06845 [Methanotrichaceae archaeon]|nr:hypothetical protein [Methanotrichaceae archaeon]
MALVIAVKTLENQRANGIFEPCLGRHKAPLNIASIKPRTWSH